MAQIVIQHYLDKYQTMANTLTDISFDCLPFLVSREPVYNVKGQKTSKSYCDKAGREAVRIFYNQIIETYHYNKVDYADVFVGVSKTIQYLNWAGEIAYSKSLQPYYFNLEPVFQDNDTEKIIGFSSKKQREILKQERFAADDLLAAKNPTLYGAFINRYNDSYNYYLRTGIKDNLVKEINSETDEVFNNFFSNKVSSSELMAIKKLILNNLQ